MRVAGAESRAWTAGFDCDPAPLDPGAGESGDGAIRPGGLAADRGLDREGPFVLSSASGSIIAHGARRTFTTPLASGLADEVDRMFASDSAAGAPGIVVGAIPFDPTASTYLFAPRQLEVLPGSADPGPYLGSASTGPVPLLMTSVANPTPEYYRASVRRALRLIEGTDHGAPLSKVVLSRTLMVRSNATFRVPDLIARLRSDASVTAYAAPLPAQEDGTRRTLVGASPELLVARKDRMLASTPLAGSARRSPNDSIDRMAAEALLASGKDLREHAAVVEWVADRLAPFCTALSVPRSPSLMSTQSMWHLGTAIRGKLRDPRVSSLSLAAALHPTPAVCGYPYSVARDTIESLEPFDRGFFSGAVGWCDATGDGKWYVAIRCAEVTGRTARLFAGAGIVAGSDPERESAETAAKFLTMLQALGVAEDGGPVEARA